MNFHSLSGVLGGLGKTKKLIILALGLALVTGLLAARILPVYGAPVTTTFATTEDTFVKSDTPTTTNGSSTTLKIKPTFPTETGYLKFNVSGLVGPISTATLRVYANSGMAWGFDAYAVPSNGWNGATMNYNTRAALGTKLGSFPSGNLTGWISVSVTPAITGNGTYSFGLVGTYWQEISLASKESGANAPQLVITTTGAPDTTAPSSPTSLNVGSASTSSLPLSWSASTDDIGVSGYGLYKDGSLTGTTNSTSTTFSGLNCGTTYSLGVDAYDAAGNRSAVSSATGTTSVCPDTTPPTKPLDLAVTGSSENSVSLSWTASSDNTAVTGYSLYKDGSLIGTTTATSFTFSGLACGTPYSLGVDAYDAATNHSAQTSYIASTSPCDTTAPSVPANLSISSTTTTAISVQWDPSTDDRSVTGYRIYFDGTLQSNTTATSFNKPGLNCGTSHTVAVDAYDAAGNHSAQTTLIVNTLDCPPDTSAPTTPTSLSVGSPTTTSLPLSWSGSTDNVGVTGYNVYLNGVKVNSTASLSYSFSGLNCGVTYNLGVEAFDAAGNISTPLATLSTSTASCAPISTTFTTTEDTFVKSDTATTTNGSSTTLKVKPSNPTETAYLKFNVSGLAGPVSTATLRVYAISGMNWGFDAYTVPTNTWNGATMNYNTRAALGSKLGSFPSGNLTGWVTVSVTPAITGNGTYSFGLVGTYWQEISLASKESGANAPQLVITTTGAPDTSAPTTPTSLSVGSPTTTSLPLSWSGSTDNVGVTGYGLYKDGNLIGSTSSLSNTLTGLTCGTTYNLGVDAYDAAGNRSATASLNVTTLGCGTQTTPAVVPDANVNGVTVGPGFVEASARQVIRTATNKVYVIVADDNPCQNTGSGVVRVFKGNGAQPANASVPTAFAEVDTVNHPVSAGNASCQFSAATAVLLSPETRLDNSGIMHMAYIDGNNGNLYYQTFSTATDTWGTRTIIATGAQTNSGSGWPRGGQVGLSLDANNIPFVAFATNGTANTIKVVNKLTGTWSSPVTIFSGTNEMHPAMVTSLDGSLHLAWLDNALAAHSVIKYARYSAGSWGTVETVSSGDNLVLANGDDDQGPSIATDSQNRPHVLYMDGTVNGPDNYVRMRYRTTGGVWTDNTPPGVAGASNPAGNWYAHTPQNYISNLDSDFVFLGHDNNISPGGYQYQTGGSGNNWSAYAALDPRNQTNTTAGAAGLDGSASIRFDPLRDNNPGIIDLIYYDENDGTAGYAHHATVYYKAIQLN